MVNRVQTLRSSVPGTAPAPGTRQPGELYVNFPDNALGVIDPTQNPVDLIPVRYFSSLASYFTGDCVLQNGRIYVATGIFGPGPFNPADWNVVTMATDLALYMPLSGGTFTGVVRFPANNSVVINGAAASQRAILGQTAGLNRWQMQLGDFTAESGANAGSNFVLTSMSDAGGNLGVPLTISRASGITTLQGLSLPGGAAGDALTTDGAGNLSWAVPAAGGTSVTVSDTPPASPVEGDLWFDSVSAQTFLWFTDSTSSQWVIANNAQGVAGPPGPAGAPGAPGVGFPDAPTDGQLYGRQDVAGTVDWTPVPTDFLPLSGGTLTGLLTVPELSAPQAIGDNRIINGDMRIDQRNDGTNGTANGYTADRWQFYGSLVRGAWQRAASGCPGFPDALSFTSNSAYTAVAADIFYFSQPIEANMVSDFQWGTANAQPVTLSFWAFSSLAGVFSGSISNATRSYVFIYTLTANVWTKINIPIPGDTAGTWVMSGNGSAFQLFFDLGSGTNFRSAAGAWVAGNYVGATGSISVVGTNGAELWITGVKLEIGSVATPFNRQSLAKSLADCQRYYQTGNIRVRGWSGAVTGIVVGHSMLYPVNMRATPTLVDQYTSIVSATPGVQPISPSTIYVYGISTTINAQLSLDGTFTAYAEL
jgi:hypothetical protein